MNEIAYPLTQIQKYSSQQIDKVTYYCSSILPPERQEVDKKMQIYSWLRKLPQIQLQQVLSFTSYFRVNSLLKMYKKDQKLLHEYIEYDRNNIKINIENDLEQYYYVRECCHTDNQQLIAAQKYIIENTYISDIEWLYDTLTLKGDIEEIIKCFEILTKGEIFKYDPIIEEKKDDDDSREYYEIQLQQEIKQTQQFNLLKKKQQNKGPFLLAEIIVNEIEKATLIKFYQFIQKQTFTREDQLFNYTLNHLNFDTINFDQEYLNFKLLFKTNDDKLTFIDEKLIRITWDRQIKSITLNQENIQQQIDPILKQMNQLFQVPLKLTINESVLFCKYLVFKQFNQLFPLKKPPQESLKEEKKSVKKIEKVKTTIHDIKQQTQLEQVNSYFTNNEKSKVLPQTEEKKKSSNKIKDDQFYPEEQLYECSSNFITKITQTVLVEIENYKQYKKKLKKAKIIKKTQQIETQKIEVPDNQCDILDEWSDKPKSSKRQKKKQMEKQRKKNQMERKKQKNDTQQQQEYQSNEQQIAENLSSSSQDDNEEQNQDDKQEQIDQSYQQEFEEPSLQKTISSDDTEYFEVLNKKQLKKQNNQKQQKNKKYNNKKEKDKDKDIPDNHSLPDEQQYVPALKKNTSQSVQKNFNQKFEELKLQKTQSQQSNKVTLQKKETNNIQIQRSGLVKSVIQQKESQIFTYDIEKSQLQKIYKVILEQKITNDVKFIYKREIDQFNKFKAARDIAINRLQCVIKAYFKNTEPELFGSSISGLALKDSDVDMVVYGLQVFTKQQLYEPMSQLMGVLKELKWVVQCKHIFQASVPLIKVLVDPSIDFLSFKKEPKYPLMQYRNLDLNLKNNDQNQLIQIDITFELAPSFAIYNYINAYNIGIQSTDYTLQICQKINGFSECAIFLKRLLRTNDLNDSYSGGISSFCLTIMLAAIGHDHNVGQKLINFLHKYGCNFDPNKWGIYLDDKGQNNFYNIEDEPTNQPLTIISPISLEQIKINVTKIQTILQLFKQLYIKIMQNIDQIEPSLQKKISQKELLEYYNNHQIDKLVDFVQWQSSNLLESHPQ